MTPASSLTTRTLPSRTLNARAELGQLPPLVGNRLVALGAAEWRADVLKAAGDIELSIGRKARSKRVA